MSGTQSRDSSRAALYTGRAVAREGRPSLRAHDRGGRRHEASRIAIVCPGVQATARQLFVRRHTIKGEHLARVARSEAAWSPLRASLARSAQHDHQEGAFRAAPAAHHACGVLHHA